VLKMILTYQHTKIFSSNNLEQGFILLHILFSFKAKASYKGKIF